MTGVSLRCRGAEHLALPGGLDALRAGRTTGLPLLAPWANRLSQRRYRAAGVDVDLRRRRLGVDDNGLPIHGLLVGRAAGRSSRLTTRGGTARVRASIDVDAPAFPFPHRIEVAATVARHAAPRRHDDRADRPAVRCRWRSAGIPYLRVPGAPTKPSGGCDFPARVHRMLDNRGIPNGDERPERAEVDRDRYPHLRRSATDWAATDGSRSMPMTGIRSSCTATRTIPSRRCGFPRAASSPRSNR